MRIAHETPVGADIFSILDSFVSDSKTISISNISSTFIPGMLELLTLHISSLAGGRVDSVAPKHEALVVAEEFVIVATPVLSPVELISIIKESLALKPSIRIFSGHPS